MDIIINPYRENTDIFYDTKKRQWKCCNDECNFTYNLTTEEKMNDYSEQTECPICTTKVTFQPTFKMNS